MHHVIARSRPSSAARPEARTPSTRARSRATEGFSAITSCMAVLSSGRPGPAYPRCRKLDGVGARGFALFCRAERKLNAPRSTHGHPALLLHQRDTMKVTETALPGVLLLELD